MTEDLDAISVPSGRVQQPSTEELKKDFREFKVIHTFVDYDFPRVFSALSPKNEYWLFKWCDKLEKYDGADLWIAFQIPKSWLDPLEEGTASLREVLSLAKGNLYVYLAHDPLEPIDARITEYGLIPPSYIPRTDVSFKDHKTRDITKRKPEQLGIRLHILTDEDRSLRNTNVPAVFQEYISSAAHKAEADSRSVGDAALRPEYLPSDWSGLQITNLGLGSFDLECVSKPENVEQLSKACELLSRLLESKSDSDLKAIQNEMGKEGFAFATLLLKFIRNLDLSLSIKWISKNNPNGYLPVDRRRAENILELIEPKMYPTTGPTQPVNRERISTITIEMNEDEIKPIQSVTLKLTNEEAEPIRREARGVGGMQSLLRELQIQLKDDNTITLTPYQIQRILRYSSNYGEGGFQGRLAGLSRALRRVGVSLYEG